MIPNWNKKYDRCNQCWDGELCVFGGHYTHEECLAIIKADEYDDVSEWRHVLVEHQYAKFGIVHYDGEKLSGWSIQNEPKKGRVKVTLR